jgi:transposase-like protein
VIVDPPMRTLFPDGASMMRELKRRTRVIGIFPSRQSCHRLFGALLWEMHESWQLKSPLLRINKAD